MSIENATNIIDLVHQEKLLSRAELLMSEAPYPYSDKDEVLEFASNYLTRAIEGYNFYHDDLSASHNFHFDSLEPISSSLNVLPKTIEDKQNEVSSSELYAVYLHTLQEIQSTINEVKSGVKPDLSRRDDAKKFLEMLVDYVSSQTSIELLDSVDSEQFI